MTVRDANVGPSQVGIPPHLENRRVLVTGGSMGIGRAVSESLANAGAHVIVAARSADAIDSTIGALAGSGHLGLELDVRSDQSWRDAMARVDAQGRLHGLVSAAGRLGPIGALHEIDPAEFRATFDVNLHGTQLALHHCLGRLRSTGGAAVTFSGGGATSPLPRYDAYAASKAAVVRLTENVAAVAGPHGVRVNCVAPGFVATRIHEGTLSAGPAQAGVEYYEKTQRELKTGGAPAQAAADLVCFLLSPDALGISGRLISAQWDPWREESFRARLRDDPDLGTLRRIDDQFYRRI